MSVDPYTKLVESLRDMNPDHLYIYTDEPTMDEYIVKYTAIFKKGTKTIESSEIEVKPSEYDIPFRGRSGINDEQAAIKFWVNLPRSFNVDRFYELKELFDIIFEEAVGRDISVKVSPNTVPVDACSDASRRMCNLIGKICLV